MTDALLPTTEFTATTDDMVRPTLSADIIIANAPDPVFVCDLEGKILEANEAVSRLLGLRRDEVLEQSISQFLGADEAREFVVALREVVARGVTRNVRLQPRSATGESIPTTLNASALRDTDGNIIGAIGAVEQDTALVARVEGHLSDASRSMALCTQLLITSMRWLCQGSARRPFVR